MFQGSATLGKMEHARYVQSSGGVFNGSTHFDYTDYFEALPSNALERGLFLEADRMASPRLTEENLANQIAVVKEEIRVNVMNRPYGGFPWLVLPGVMFDTFPNAHNGYGSFVDLEGGDRRGRVGFFQRYYAPANAVLAVGGDFDPDDALELVERHFARVKRRARPTAPSFAEPRITSERRATTTDQYAPMPPWPSAIACRTRPGVRPTTSHGAAGRGAVRRRRVPPDPAAGAARRIWPPTSAPTSVSSAIPSTSAIRPC